jgi:enoyl-CoA hydratase/carnithine racemase
MYQALCEALARASSDPAISVVLLSGEGADFCAGNDILDFLADGLSGEALKSSPALRFLREFAVFGKPVIAAVQGRSIGIGTTMLLHCDLVYLAKNASLSAPFVNLALVPEAASSLLLPARIGHARAFALFALGESLDARTAVQWGLANAVMPGAEVLTHAHAVAMALAAKPMRALAATKRLMCDRARALAVIEAEAAELAERVSSSEARTIYEAFVKRARA